MRSRLIVSKVCVCVCVFTHQCLAAGPNCHVINKEAVPLYTSLMEGTPPLIHSSLVTGIIQWLNGQTGTQTLQ